MQRRNFIQLSTLAGVGLTLPLTGVLNACTNHPEHSLEFKNLISNLLKDWCDGMIRVQINNPSNLEEHGALGCPSCSHIHGRCMDAVYPFLYMADVSGDEKYVTAAKLVMTWAENNVSQENKNEGLLFGECKKSSSKLSEKGLHGVDLGYNVEESLNSIVMYALKAKDEALLQLVTKSLHSHLEFMLPDGAWDNSWGNRMYKWSYWGSRTCDGSQPAFGMMAHINPAFGTAAVKNTELLKACTANGLIHGGPHFISAQIPPCVHHTFAHAKPLAAMLDHWQHLPEINKNTALPRVTADGVKHFKDLDVFLFARGDWRGTVSAYDAEYHYKYDFRQASGGALGMLYHNKVGLLCAASMAEYHMVEPYNQQEQPNKDIALTPRIETFIDNVWYTNLYDLPATVSSKDENGSIELLANVKLKNVDRTEVKDTASAFNIAYKCTVDKTEIQVTTSQDIKAQTAFVLPIVSPSNEIVTKVSENKITIQKPEGLVTIAANTPIKIKDISGKRTFNMVPGVEALPLELFFDKKKTEGVNIVISID